MKTIILTTALALIITTPVVAQTHHDATEKESRELNGLAAAIHGTGIIKSIDAGDHKMIVVHDPISELGWPKMTMEFTVDPSVDMGSVRKGDKIRFTLKANGEDDYSITKIQKD